MTEDREDLDLRLLNHAVAGLMEHFDAVQIIATRDEGVAGTSLIYSGGGNQYARYGAVRAWLGKAYRGDFSVDDPDEDDD